MSPHLLPVIHDELPTLQYQACSWLEELPPTGDRLRTAALLPSCANELITSGEAKGVLGDHRGSLATTSRQMKALLEMLMERLQACKS